MEPLAPVVAFSKVKSPALSTQVRPTMTLWALQLGGTREKTSPVLFNLMRVRPTLQDRVLSDVAQHNKSKQQRNQGQTKLHVWLEHSVMQ